MPDAILAPSFTQLVQSYFAEYLMQQRALSPRTVGAYRDTFRLLLTFAEQVTGKPPTSLGSLISMPTSYWRSSTTSNKCGTMALGVATHAWRQFVPS